MRFFREAWKVPDGRAIARKVLSNQALSGHNLESITDLHTALSENIAAIASQEYTTDMLTLPDVGKIIAV